MVRFFEQGHVQHHALLLNHLLLIERIFQTINLSRLDLKQIAIFERNDTGAYLNRLQRLCRFLNDRCVLQLKTEMIALSGKIIDPNRC